MKPWIKSLLLLLPAGVITGVVLLLYIPLPQYYFFSPDQGFQLSFADQILHGNHPWSDVLGVAYGPLVFYCSALGQPLFNHTIAGEIFITFTGYFFGYLLFYMLMLRVSKNVWLSCLTLLSAVFMFPSTINTISFSAPRYLFGGCMVTSAPNTLGVAGGWRQRP